MQSKLKLLIIGGIMLLGFFLRWKNYATVPVPGDSLDEYSFTWVGLSLIRLGMPVGAIGVGGYENNLYSYINVDRIFQTGNYASPIKINNPWFDHPPLLGIFAGSFAYIDGARVFEDTTLQIIRKPMVILGVLTILLVIVLGYEMWGFGPAVISGLIYATSPLIVVSSRMVQAENLLIIWFLLILIFLKRQKWLWVGIFFSLALWTKFSAIGILPVIFWKINKGNFKNYLMGVIPGCLFLGVYYFVYGLDTFLAVTKANSSREYAIGINAFFDLITKTRITHIKLFTDGWIVASWIAFFAYRKINLLGGFVISYLAIYILFGNYPHGWYATPFWPILVIFLGKFIYDKRSFLINLLPLSVGLSRINLSGNIWRWGILGILMMSFLVKNKKILWILNMLLFVTAMVVNAFFAGGLDAHRWYKTN